MANQAQISYGNSRDYYLSIGVEKSGLGPLFLNFGFLGPNLAQKKRGSTLSHKGLGPQDTTNKLAQSTELLDYVLSQKHASKKFRPALPLKSINQSIRADSSALFAICQDQ